MTLPKSFATAGYVTPEQARRNPTSKLRRLMLRTEGEADTGKSEFILSCPGPGMVLALDRGFDALFDNATPPATRRSDFGFNAVKLSTPTQERFDPSKVAESAYYQQWVAVRKAFYAALENPDCKTVALDGDADAWEIEQLAAFGKTHGIFPAVRYADIYAERKGFLTRAWDANKIIVMTNKLKPEYADQINPATGLPLLDNAGEKIRKNTGQLVSAGFPDRNYLWQICIRHLYRPARVIQLRGKELEVHQAWGLRVLKCKVNRSLEGQELWGEDCTFTGLVQLAYPHIDLGEWGL